MSHHLLSISPLSGINRKSAIPAMAPARRPASPKTAVSGREALPAIPTAGHLWAQQDSFQGGAPRTAVCRAAATGQRQSMVRESPYYLLGNFRLGALFGHLWSPSLLRRAGTVAAGSPTFNRSGYSHDAQDRGSATRTSRSGPSVGATGGVPGWCAGYGGIPCCRKSDSGAIHGSTNPRR